MTDPDGELKELEAYHGKLALLERAAQVGLLRSGYLPASPDLLVEAGIRCVPLLECGDPEVAEAAYDRLEGVLLKLRLSPPAPATRKAVEELEQRLVQHRQQEARDTKLGLALILGLTGVILALTLLITYWFTR